MKKMDVVLYKIAIYEGKETIAKEWLEFLDKNKERGSEILVEENAYYEAYFVSEENKRMYVYMTFASDNVAESNKKAKNSENELDKTHFEYMKACADINNSLIIPAKLQMNTLEP